MFLGESFYKEYTKNAAKKVRNFEAKRTRLAASAVVSKTDSGF